MIIKVLGPGCANCNNLEDRVYQALKQNNIQATVEKITDYGVMMTYGMMGSPGLVINEKLVSTGKLLSVKEIVTLIEKYSV
jgi:small redox-active disulfide protein 2